WVALAAHLQQRDQSTPARSAAWYAKSAPTFSDAIASARRAMWPALTTFRMSGSEPDMRKVPVALFDRFIDTLCYAA
ncbi:MAG TPA: hypothetical protein VFR55_03070, partial [Dehalococcoidia bacterium]|nr:hypothetical protein [Dehalococcoidia bacterium]